jgi:hypothetical protein
MIMVLMLGCTINLMLPISLPDARSCSQCRRRCRDLDSERRLRVELRQLLPRFLKPPLIAGKVHNIRRATARKGGLTGSDHRNHYRILSRPMNLIKL